MSWELLAIIVAVVAAELFTPSPLWPTPVLKFAVLMGPIGVIALLTLGSGLVLLTAIASLHAVRDRHPAWAAAMILAWIFGLGWVVALMYLARRVQLSAEAKAANRHPHLLRRM